MQTLNKLILKGKSILDITDNNSFGGNTITHFPSIGLKLTGACRFSCPFCCEPNRKQVLYHIENFFTITRILRQSGTQRLCFTGGDPLLYPNIVQLLQYTKSLGFYNLLLTSDGFLLKEKYKELIPYLDAIRFSIQAIGCQHDEIVGKSGAFDAIKEMVDILNQKSLPCYVATVVTSINKDRILDIAEWCVHNNVLQYYLFGLMRSGNGNAFINQEGEVSQSDIGNILFELNNKQSYEKTKVIYYDFKNKAECILIYGNGRIVIDPYPISPSYQLEIGNVFSNTISEIISNFSKDPSNNEGYCGHLLKRRTVDKLYKPFFQRENVIYDR